MGDNHVIRDWLVAAALLGVVGEGGAVEGPWRLNDALNTPDWLTLSGETRARVELLDNQFRAGKQGNDSILALRTLLRADMRTRATNFTVELADSRAYFDTNGNSLSTSTVNALGILQASMTLPLKTGALEHELKLGRFTLDIASRRFVERNGYRNTINNYEGAHWNTRWGKQTIIDAFLVNPVRRYPRDGNDLGNNDVELDRQDSNQHFWGIHLQRRNWLGPVHADLFVYGLDEHDDDRPSPDRDVWAPGFRLFRPQEPGALDFELEGTYRLGSRSASSQPDAETLKVRAYSVHGELGWTFEGRGRPRLGFEFDLASGDDPDDNTYTRFERFYGTRRRDLGHTGIYGPLTRSNLFAPGLRFSFAGQRFSGQFVYKRAFLPSRQDAWIVARLQDSAGASGDEIGDTLDVQVRYWLRPKSVRLEIGGAALWYGSFAENVPGAPAGSRSYFGYGQARIYF